ncbi:MAG: error-prone DNA polymerase, partial [Pirellulales bacterium]
MYSELHCKSNFSFLEGASHPEELVRRAAELGYAALAITDRNSLAGVVRAHGAAKDVGLKLLIGAEIHPVDAPPVVLLATDRAAYGRLARLITRGRRNAPKGECHLTFDDIAEHSEGLLAAIHNESAIRNPGYPLGAAIHNESAIRNPQSAIEKIRNYKALFGSRCSLLAELHLGPDDRGKLQRRMQLSRDTGVPLVAAGGVLYHVARRRALHDVLTATRLGGTVDQVRGSLPPNVEHHLKTLDQLQSLFAQAPQALRRTIQISDQCSFSLDELRYEYPEELVPDGFTPIEYLAHMAWRGAHKRYPEGLPEKVRGLIQHELALIGELRYEAYFLTVWDLVRFARHRGILCQGRGSAANSAICYCLGITSVDPSRTDLLFERFVSRERNEAPDIDVDFEHERREEVLQYIYDKYGRERVGMTAEVITYRPRSAVRDVGKALGLSLEQVDQLAKSLEGRGQEDMQKRFTEAGLEVQSQVGQQLVALTEQLCGFPRHLSQHVGGMVMTQGPLCELVPIENAAMADRTVIQWNKDDLDELGILKVDCLSLGMLTAIRKCFAFVQQQTGRALTLANVPAEDKHVYDMVCRADTVGVFQIESRGQMSMLPRLRPRCFYDLVIEVAIVRPGPIQGNMVHPYLRRRMGQEQPTYPDDEIRQVLEKTLGVPLFQEQAMRMAMVAAGFTPGEADQLRRAMGAWRRPGVIDGFRERLINGMREKGYSDEFSESIFRQIRGFGEYGFPESHAASFALLVYVSAWLKHHHQAAFTAALLNSQPMGFYAPAQLVRDASQHGVEVRPADVNFSNWDCTLEGQGARPALRLGLRMISGLPRTAADTIVECRATVAHSFNRRPIGSRADPARIPVGLRLNEEKCFSSIEDFTARTRLNRAVVMRLSEADAFGSLAVDRRGALWNALAQEKSYRDLPLFASAEEPEDEDVQLPALSGMEQVVADYQTVG